MRPANSSRIIAASSVCGVRIARSGAPARSARARAGDDSRPPAPPSPAGEIVSGGVIPPPSAGRAAALAGTRPSAAG